MMGTKKYKGIFWLHMRHPEAVQRRRSNTRKILGC
jgi:hypothetical protein